MFVYKYIQNELRPLGYEAFAQGSKPQIVDLKQTSRDRKSVAQISQITP